MLGSVSYSQDSGNSKAELISRCERAADEVDAGRLRIAAQESRLKDYEALIERGEKLQLLSDEEIKLRKAETADLRVAIAKERDALALKQREADQLRKDLASATKKKNFFKKLAIIGIGAAAGLYILK